MSRAKGLRPGTIGVVCDDLARYSGFAACLDALWRPKGTVVQWAMGTEVAAARNQIVRMAQGDWVWFLDDDHLFATDTLEALLNRRLSIVAPLVLTRKPPFQSVGVIDGQRLHGGRLVGCQGVYPVDATGTAGMLVQRTVFEAVPEPWFEVGRITPDGMGEDLAFCAKARAVGYSVHVDLDVPMGHIAPCGVWPNYDGEGKVAGSRLELGGETWAVS